MNYDDKNLGPGSKKGWGFSPMEEFHSQNLGNGYVPSREFADLNYDFVSDDDESEEEEIEIAAVEERKMWDKKSDGDCVEKLCRFMFTESEQQEVGGQWDRLVALQDVSQRSIDFQKRHLFLRIAWAFLRNSMGGVILSNTRQTKYQALEFYGIAKGGEDDHEPHITIQYGNSPNKRDAEIFLRGETVEYIECSDDLARALEKIIMLSSIGKGTNDVGSGLVFFKGFLKPIQPTKFHNNASRKSNIDTSSDDVSIGATGVYNPLPAQNTFGVEFELSCGIGSQPHTVGQSLVDHADVRVKRRIRKWSRPGFVYISLGDRNMNSDDGLFGDEWMIVDDNSIEGNPDWAHSCQFEIVSPILRGEIGMDVCLRVLTTTVDTSAIHINKSMGFHVHIGLLQNQTSLIVLQHICWNFCRFETIIDSFLDKSRVGNEYCKSNREGIHQCDEGIKNKIFECKLKDGKDGLFELVNPSGRYHKLNISNLKTGERPTIEFRQHHATDNLDDIEAWIRFCMAFVQKSIHQAAAVIHEDITKTTDKQKFEDLFVLIGDESLKRHFYRRCQRAE